MSCQLTEEQRKKIDENRKQALAKRTGKALNSPPQKNLPKQSSSAPYATDLFRSKVSLSLNSNNLTAERIPKEAHYNVFAKPQQSCSKPNSEHSAVISTQLFSKTGTREKALLNKDKFYGTQESVIRGKCVLSSLDRFAVDVGYHSSLIEHFKQMESRSYDTSTRTWSFNIREYEQLMKGVAVFQPSVQIEGLPNGILQTLRNSKDDGIPEADLSDVDDKLVNALLPFQREGVDFGIHHEGRLLLADDMGLGKTLQALCIACYYRFEWPLLIISPSSVRHDWAKQACLWLPSLSRCDVNVIDSGKTSITGCPVTIMSYDLLSKKAIGAQGHRFKVIIMDESHFLKNFKAVRTKAALHIVKFAKRVILLSGTPALSRPSELYPQISCVRPSMFTFHDFGLRYCNAKQQPWGWDYSGSSNMTELQLILKKKIMIRRQKKDVLSQLPTKTRRVVFLNPDQLTSQGNMKKTYKMMNGTKLKGTERHGVLLQYFNQTCKVKLSAVRDYILDLVKADKKFLVFAHHQEMLDTIEDAVREKVTYMRIDGRTTSEQRSFFCQKFQKSDDYRIAILSITAANAGLNLSAASLVIFAELFWNPGILVQAEDRVHRIGQENAVSIHYLIAQNTADDFIWPLVQDKFDVLGKAGLTRDNFSEVDTMQVEDKKQRKIMDMFNEEFIEISNSQDLEVETVPETNARSDPGASKDQSSPSVKSPSGRKRKDNGKSSNNSSPGTPSKRQMNITSFFPLTPPSKASKLDSTNDTGNVPSCKRLFDGNSNQECEVKDQAYKSNVVTPFVVDCSDEDKSKDGKCFTPAVETISNNGGNETMDTLLTQEDIRIMSEIDWDEDF